jgi:hypothetical protein
VLLYGVRTACETAASHGMAHCSTEWRVLSGCVAPLTSCDTVGKSHTAARSARSHVGTRRTIALSCNRLG